MASTDNFLQNLPKVDENSEIQTNSLDALNSFLPKDTFCLRDERIEDYGVDASLEILESRAATNFRAQIQLKGTRSLEPKEDGSYSLQVKTNNLNYLLNNPISLYILYIEPKNEFRFVWARNEFRRLDGKNRDWRKQEKVTLKFNDILDLPILDEIKTQIIKHSSLNRELNETLVLSQSNILVEINPETFEITDKKIILNLISSYGISLINGGYVNEIIEKINLLENEDREKSVVKTVKAYAEYYLGHYHTVKEILIFLEAEEQEISENDQQIIDWLNSACDYLLGTIDSDKHTEILRIIAENDCNENFSSFRFDYIHRLLLREEKNERRKELVDQLRDEIKKIPQNGSQDEEYLLFNYYILEAELGTIIKHLVESMLNISMRKSLNVYKDINDLAQDVSELLSANRRKATEWNNELTGIFEKTENQLLKADILVENVLFIISELSIIRFHSMANGVAFEDIENDVFEKCKKYLDNAVQIYSNLKLLERKLRAESYLADLINLKGQNEEADKILTKVSETSDKIGYAQVKANAENPLSKIFDKVKDAASSTDFDEKLANSNDEEMEDFAQDLLENLRLPQYRFKNIKKDVLATQEISKEKLDWCEYIELHQNLRHTQSSETYYATDPDRFGYCELYGYKSAIGNSDYKAIILAFKRTYCDSCLERKPKKINNNERPN